MIPKDLFEKVRRIEITTSRMVTDVFAGAYHSVFKGQGIEFDEVREYNIGDDIRTIDWNVTARHGKPFVKKFVEERELTVMVLVDASASNRFASQVMLKSQLAAELAALLAFSATKNNDRVGLIIFTDQVEHYIPPRKGSRHILRIIREVLYFEAKGRGTNLTAALEFLNKITTRRTISFLLSDFLTLTGSSAAEKLKKILSITNKKHDLIAVTLNDPREIELTDTGLVEMEDWESGSRYLIDTSDKKLRRKYKEENLKRFKFREDLFRSVGMDFVNTFTHEPYVNELVKFFYKRKRRV